MQGLLIVVATSLLLSPSLAGAEDEEKTTRLTLRVLAEENQQTVADAHVIVRFVVERTRKRDRPTSWEAKTNRRGVLVLSNLPQGSVKVQVIARGYQTFGTEFELSKPEEELTIQLKPPQEQHSAY